MSKSMWFVRDYNIIDDHINQHNQHNVDDTGLQRNSRCIVLLPAANSAMFYQRRLKFANWTSQCMPIHMRCLRCDQQYINDNINVNVVSKRATSIEHQHQHHQHHQHHHHHNCWGYVHIHIHIHIHIHSNSNSNIINNSNDVDHIYNISSVYASSAQLHVHGKWLLQVRTPFSRWECACTEEEYWEKCQLPSILLCISLRGVQKCSVQVAGRPM